MISAISNVSNSTSYQSFKGKAIPKAFTGQYIPEEPHITAEMRERLSAQTGFSERIKNKLAENIDMISDMNLPDANSIINKDGSILHLLPDGSLVKIAHDSNFADKFEVVSDAEDFMNLLPANALLATHKIGELSDKAETAEALRSLIEKTGEAIDILG